MTIEITPDDANAKLLKNIFGDLDVPQSANDDDPTDQND